MKDYMGDLKMIGEMTDRLVARIDSLTEEIRWLKGQMDRAQRAELKSRISAERREG